MSFISFVRIISLLLLLNFTNVDGFIFNGGGGRQRNHQRNFNQEATQSRDFYKILGVKRGANSKQIKKAYRDLAREWHPDRHTGTDKEEIANEKFMDINAAYETLSDEELRAKYDRCGEACLNDSGGGGHQGQQQDGYTTIIINGQRVHVSPGGGFSGFGGFGGQHQASGVPQQFKRSDHVYEVKTLAEINSHVVGGDSGDSFIREGWPTIIYTYHDTDNTTDIVKAAKNINSEQPDTIVFLAVNCTTSPLCRQQFDSKFNSVSIATSKNGDVRFDKYNGRLTNEALEKYLHQKVTKDHLEIKDPKALYRYLNDSTNTNIKLIFIVKDKKTRVSLAKRIFNYRHANYAIISHQSLRAKLKQLIPELPAWGKSLVALHVHHYHRGDDLILGDNCEWVKGLTSAKYSTFTENVRRLATDKLNKTGVYGHGDQLLSLDRKVQKRGYCDEKESATCILLVHPDEKPTREFFNKIDLLRSQYANEKQLKFGILPAGPYLDRILGEPINGKGNSSYILALKPKRKLWKAIDAKEEIDIFVENIINNEGLRLNAEGVKKLSLPFSLPDSSEQEIIHDEL